MQYMSLDVDEFCKKLTSRNLILKIDTRIYTMGNFPLVEVPDYLEDKEITVCLSYTGIEKEDFFIVFKGPTVEFFMYLNYEEVVKINVSRVTLDRDSFINQE